MNQSPFNEQGSHGCSRTARQLGQFARTFGGAVTSTGNDNMSQLSAVAEFSASVITAYAKSRGIPTNTQGPRRDALLMAALPITGATCQCMELEPFELATLICLTAILPVHLGSACTSQQVGVEIADEQQRIIARYKSAMAQRSLADTLNGVGATVHELLRAGPSSFRFEDLCDVLDSWLGVATYDPAQAVARRGWVLSELTILSTHRGSIEMMAQMFVDGGQEPMAAIREATIHSLYTVDAGIRAAVSVYTGFDGLLQEWRGLAQERGRPGAHWDSVWAGYFASIPVFDKAMSLPTPQEQGRAFGDAFAARLGVEFLDFKTELALYSGYSIGMVAATKIVRGDPFPTS